MLIVRTHKIHWLASLVTDEQGLNISVSLALILVIRPCASVRVWLIPGLELVTKTTLGMDKDNLLYHSIYGRTFSVSMTGIKHVKRV